MAPVFLVSIVSLCIFDCSWLIREFVLSVDGDDMIWFDGNLGFKLLELCCLRAVLVCKDN